MSWGPGQRLSYNAVIGYTDGKSHHKETTVPPENLFGHAGRYRPQQMNGTTGKLGQLVYDLSGPVGSDIIDPRISCQTWAMKEPDPAEWTNGLFSCPCTRSQALEDLSFVQYANPDMKVKVPNGQRWVGAGGHIFQSILSNEHGSGKRCVYEPDGPLLVGYNERYFSGHSVQNHIGNIQFSIFDQICHESNLYSIITNFY